MTVEIKKGKRWLIEKDIHLKERKKRQKTSWIEKKTNTQFKTIKLT